MSEQNQVSKPAITKEQWQQIEEEMASSYMHICFSYQGHEISVRRERKNESTTALVVYIDGVIKGNWFCRTDNKPEDAPKILADVWNVRTMARYKKAEIEHIEKIWGKRKAKQTFPNLHGRIEWLEAYFPKASVLCRQFKKLKGLELTKAYFLKNKEADVA